MKINVDGVHLDGSETAYSWYNLSTGVKTTSSSGSFPRPYQLFRYEKTFDASGNLLGTGGNTLQTTIDAYDANGNVKQVTTPNWQPQVYDWYSNGRLKSTSFLNHKKEYTYYPGTRFVKNFIDIDGQYLTYEYDKLTRLSKTKARLNNVVTDYTYHHKEISGDIYNWVRSTTTFTATTNSSLTTRTTIDYLVIQNGTYTSKLNGYYHFIANGSKGQSLFGFVGMKNAGSTISTFHIKSAAQLGLK